MRRVHTVKHNKVTTTPNYCIWFDTETRQIPIDDNCLEHKLTFGWAAFRRKRSNGQWTKPEWFKFKDKSEFWKWVDEHTPKKTKLYLFCHNTSFDLPVLDCFTQVPELGYTLKFACIEAPPTILHFKRKDHTLVMLDTLNYFRMSLKDVGKFVGLKKLDMPDVTINSKQADDYCRRDVEIIMTACLKWFEFIETQDMGGFASTLAGQSMRAYRHRFMKHEILIDGNEKATTISRNAYFGGRTECWRIGKFNETLHLFDVNSMYPFVMRDNLFPHKLRGTRVNPSLEWVAENIKEFAMCAECEVETDTPFYPIRKDDKLVFPVGCFVTSLSTPEIVHALENGHLNKVRRAAVYYKAPLFKEFVSELYAARLKAAENGDTVMAFNYKTLLNSHYGKWGQRGQHWDSDYNTQDKSAKVWLEIDAKTGKATRKRQLAGLVQTLSKEVESRDSFPAIAAHVTAYARCLLWNYAEQAGIGNTFYMDTDSLLVNETGKDNLKSSINPSRLGCLKHEGTFDDVEIWGSKDYRFGTKEKHKGVKKSAVWLSPCVVRQDQWSSLKGAIKDGHTDRPRTKKVVKTLSRKYTKGVVTKRGRIKPLRISM